MDRDLVARWLGMRQFQNCGGFSSVSLPGPSLVAPPSEREVAGFKFRDSWTIDGGRNSDWV